MSESVESKLHGGLLLALGREEAKSVFAPREDQALRDAITEIAAVASQCNSVHCQGQWATLHRVFADGSLDPEAGQLPLNQCILGGRQLHQGPEMTVALVRPDLVPHVSDALQQLTADDLQDRLSRAQLATDDPAVQEANVGQITKVFSSVRDFYDAAARERLAVLFCVRHAE